MRRNVMGKLSDMLFDEMRRLESVDHTDRDAMRAEIERARAMQIIAGQLNQSARTMLETVRLHAEYGGKPDTTALLTGS